MQRTIAARVGEVRNQYWPRLRRHLNSIIIIIITKCA